MKVKSLLIYITVFLSSCRAVPALSAESRPLFERSLEAVKTHVAVKTNLLYWAALVPNVGAEVSIDRRFSVSASWMYAWWSKDVSHRYYRMYGGDLEGRFYPFVKDDGPSLSGHHFGVYAAMYTYDIEFGGKGELAPRWSWSAGIGYGYTLPISRHLDLDFALQAGYLGGRYYKYRPIDNHYVWQGTHRRNYLGPTKLEVSLKWYLDASNIRR